MFGFCVDELLENRFDPGHILIKLLVIHSLLVFAYLLLQVGISNLVYSFPEIVVHIFTDIEFNIIKFCQEIVNQNIVFLNLVKLFGFEIVYMVLIVEAQRS